MNPSIWSRDFWKATVERIIRGAAIAALVVVGGDAFNAFNVNWEDVLGSAAGGAVLSLLLSLSGNLVSGNGPSFVKAETVTPEYGTSLNEREGFQTPNAGGPNLPA